MMKVYHWTSFKNAKRILHEGLRRWSFICRCPEDWHGQVCLEIDLPYEIDWDSRDKHAQWQAVVPEIIEATQISLYGLEARV